MFLFRAPLVVALSAALAGACENKSDRPTTLSEELQEREAELLCAKGFDCCPSLYPGDLRGCRAVEELNVSARADRIAAAVERGAATYDESRFVQCLELLQALDCAGWAAAEGGDLPAPCLDYVKGKRNDGEACGDHFECVSGRCSMAEGARTGRCAARGGEGAPCAGIEEDCQPELRCRPDTNSCVRAVPTGGECERETDCNSFNCESGACVTECQVPL